MTFVAARVKTSIIKVVIPVGTVGHSHRYITYSAYSFNVRSVPILTNVKFNNLSNTFEMLYDVNSNV